MKQLINVFMILLILFIVWQIQKNYLIEKAIDGFANFYEDHHPLSIIQDSEKCYNKLYKENNKYYLVNTNRPIVLNKNPREFKTYNEYLHFAKIQKEKHGCPIIDITNNRRQVKKANLKRDDPFESYERRCNKEVSKHKYISDNDLFYGEGHGITQKLIVGNTGFDSKNSYEYHNDFDVESCMKELYLTEHDGLQATPL